MLSNNKMLTLLTKTTEPSARVAGTKRNIHELFDDLTLTAKTEKPKTKSEDEAEEEAPISAKALLSILDLSLELSSMSMSLSSSSSSSSPPQKKLLDLCDDELSLIHSLLKPDDCRALALTCHDAHSVIARM